MTEKDKSQRECRFCNYLQVEIWLHQEVFRCQKGRFDNKYGDRFYLWTGIWRPNKTVATAQKDCPYFKVHPRVKLISRKGRP